MVCSIVLRSVNSLILPPSFSVALINELITPVPISLKGRRGKRSDILQERREGLERKRQAQEWGRARAEWERGAVQVSLGPRSCPCFLLTLRPDLSLTCSLTSAEKTYWRVRRSLEHHALSDGPQLETSCSRGCGFGTRSQAVFGEVFF